MKGFMAKNCLYEHTQEIGRVRELMVFGENGNCLKSLVIEPEEKRFL
jgi:hypothetical protein